MSLSYWECLDLAFPTHQREGGEGEGEEERERERREGEGGEREGGGRRRERGEGDICLSTSPPCHCSLIVLLCPPSQKGHRSSSLSVFG